MLSKSEIKRLNSLKIKKYRVSEGLFIAEGLKILIDFIDSGMNPEMIYCTDSSMLPLFKQTDAQICRLISEDSLSKISSLKNPQGCLGVFRIPETVAEVPKDEWIFILDNIQDPGNLGTIIRIADWFGIRYVVCSPDTVEAYNAKVVQSCMGSLARVNMLYTDIESFIAENKRPIYAGLLNGTDIRNVGFKEPGALLIGNEGNGVRDALLPYIDHPLMIPRLGGAESLNAGVAAGIMAAWALLQR
jgi:RNA methyltransferase, TrmH family